MSRNKTRSNDFVKGDLLTNEQQNDLYRPSEPELALVFLSDFYLKHDRNFFFVDCLQKKIMKDMRDKKNLKWLKVVIPFMMLTGESLDCFMNFGPLRLVKSYEANNLLPKAVIPIWERRKNGMT